ncbi:MAG TPA: hypothetical protein VF616_20150 [Duganella sp.]|uniref:hypothetical protein n=1 Tax=Duganella sp. TaxID=1904440 RepID=UPI002ED0FF0A
MAPAKLPALSNESRVDGARLPRPRLKSKSTKRVEFAFGQLDGNQLVHVVDTDLYIGPQIGCGLLPVHRNRASRKIIYSFVTIGYFSQLKET